MSELSGEYIKITGEYDNDAEMSKVLYIVYNPQLTSIKINQSTSITPTIGARYPFYRKNALTNYRTFSIGGLITYESQQESALYWDGKEFTEAIKRESYWSTETLQEYMLSNEKELMSTINNYTDAQYLEKRDAAERLDWIYERCFREAILEFLLDGKPKLLESEQEGQILVVLTDISLSPNQQLGRKYSAFSATATEIGNAKDLDLLNKYNLLSYPKVEYSDNNLDG